MKVKRLAHDYIKLHGEQELGHRSPASTSPAGSPTAAVSQGDKTAPHPHPFKFCGNEAHCTKQLCSFESSSNIIGTHLKMVKVKRTFVVTSFF